MSTGLVGEDRFCSVLRNLSDAHCENASLRTAPDTIAHLEVRAHQVVPLPAPYPAPYVESWLGLLRARALIAATRLGIWRQLPGMTTGVRITHPLTLPGNVVITG